MKTIRQALFSWTLASTLYSSVVAFVLIPNNHPSLPVLKRSGLFGFESNEFSHSDQLKSRRCLAFGTMNRARQSSTMPLLCQANRRSFLCILTVPIMFDADQQSPNRPPQNRPTDDIPPKDGRRRGSARPEDTVTLERRQRRQSQTLPVTPSPQLNIAVEASASAVPPRGGGGTEAAGMTG